MKKATFDRIQRMGNEVDHQPAYNSPRKNNKHLGV